MSEQTTPTPGGWLDEPGVPLNPWRSGEHHLGPGTGFWDAASQQWTVFLRFRYISPELIAQQEWVVYKGPVTSPEDVALLKEALRFYANKESWRHTISLGHPQIDGTTSPAEEDRGKRARAALKEGADAKS